MSNIQKYKLSEAIRSFDCDTFLIFLLVCWLDPPPKGIQKLAGGGLPPPGSTRPPPGLIPVFIINKIKTYVE